MPRSLFDVVRCVDGLRFLCWDLEAHSEIASPAGPKPKRRGPNKSRALEPQAEQVHTANEVKPFLKLRVMWPPRRCRIQSYHPGILNLPICVVHGASQSLGKDAQPVLGDKKSPFYTSQNSYVST